MSLNLWPMPPPSTLLSTVSSVSDTMTINAGFTELCDKVIGAQDVEAED